VAIVSGGSGGKLLIGAEGGKRALESLNPVFAQSEYAEKERIAGAVGCEAGFTTWRAKNNLND